MPIWVRHEEVQQLRAELDADVEVGEEERLRTIASVEVGRVVSVVSATLSWVVALPVILGALVWLAGTDAVFAPALILALIAAFAPAAGIYQVGRRWQRRTLRGAIRRAHTRPALDAVGASTSVAVGTATTRDRR